MLLSIYLKMKLSLLPNVSFYLAYLISAFDFSQEK